MKRAGFTLIELMVVLVILAILTTVAVTSVDTYQDQARYEATQRTMQNIEDAVLGPANQRDADGSPLITGFVADMGRLPNGIDTDGTLYPSELWSNTTGLLSFGIRQANSSNVGASDVDLDVYVPCGWRGPYVRLGPGQNKLLDGWGNAFDLLDESRTALPGLSDAGYPAQARIVRSRGSDYPTVNAAPTSDYKEELYLNIKANAIGAYPVLAAPIDRFHASTVQVTVTDPSSANGYPDAANGAVVIKYFGPDPATGGIKVISSTALTPSGTGPVTYAFVDDAITAGPRVFRAYQNVSVKKSDVLRVVLPAGGKAIELKLK